MPATSLSPIESALVVTILAMLRRGELSRAEIEESVLFLAEWQRYAGLSCLSGTLGFPFWEPGTEETTTEQRRAKWEQEVSEAPDVLLVEAWAQLWSRQPPRSLERYAPPLEGLYGRDTA
jgi:hypothetical protein